MALLFVAGGLTAQSDYRLPEAVAIPGAERLGARLLEELRPFGWSPDGKFAYLSVEEVDGRGGVIYSYRIFDAVSDVELYLFEDDSFRWPEGSPGAENPTASHSWARSGEEVSQALSRHRIRRQAGIVVRSFPAVTPLGTYIAEAVITLEDQPEDPAFDRVDGYEVWIRRAGESAKRIAAAQDVFAVDGSVLGFFTSPFEPRILVLFGQERYVFEGTAIEYHFFGSSLVAGFRPQTLLSDAPPVSGSYVHEADVAGLEVIEYPDGTVSLDGYAEWIGPGGAESGNVNVGEISGRALYSRGRAIYDDGYGCRLDLRFTPGAVTVQEDGSCGGLNVTFAGSYRRSE